jgi:hypothetical protein
MSTTENHNRNWIDPTATASNQNNTSLRLGISIDNITAHPLNDMPPGILPASGPLRATPTDHFVSTPRGNKATK